jgi:hypothetical protein
VAAMNKEGLYPKMFLDEYGYYSQQLDNYSDSLTLNIMYNMNESPCMKSIAGDFIGQSAGENPLEIFTNIVKGEGHGLQQYARQWCGSMAIIRPLMTILNYQEIRIISQYIFFLLLFVSALLLYKKINAKISICYIISMLAISPDIVSASINLAGPFYIVVISIIFACLLYPKVNRKGYFLFVTGGLTAYFDLFSIPFITFGMITIVLLAIDYNENKNKSLVCIFLDTVKCGIAWVSGYLTLWLSKWVFASIILKENIFLDAYREIKVQSTNKNIPWGPDTTIGYITEANKLCFENMFPNNIIKSFIKEAGIVPFISCLVLVIGILAFLVIMSKKNRGISKQQLYFSSILIIIAVFPYVCYTVMYTHAFVHFWMWYRIQVITLFALTLACANLISLGKTEINI